MWFQTGTSPPKYFRRKWEPFLEEHVYHTLPIPWLVVVWLHGSPVHQLAATLLTHLSRNIPVSVAEGLSTCYVVMSLTNDVYASFFRVDTKSSRWSLQSFLPREASDQFFNHFDQCQWMDLWNCPFIFKSITLWYYCDKSLRAFRDNNLIIPLKSPAIQLPRSCQLTQEFAA